MQMDIVALRTMACLFLPALQAAPGDAATVADRAESYCAQQADGEQVGRDARAEYIADCVTDRRAATQSDEGDAIDKSAGND